MQLYIETIGEYSPPECSVRIKRQSDRFIFDNTDKTFKLEAKVNSPWIELKASTSPVTPNLVETFVELDVKQFIDGDYTIYYHDTSIPIKKLFDIAEVYIRDGSSTTQRVPSATEIAARILDGNINSHKIVGSVGAWMIDVTNRLQAIQTKLDMEK